MDKVESECDSVTNEISAKTFNRSMVPLRGGRMNFSPINRSLTPKFSTKGYGYRCKLRQKSQRLYRSQLQQQQKQKENEMVENVRKPNNGTATVR